jgi:hypothetical protein
MKSRIVKVTFAMLFLAALQAPAYAEQKPGDCSQKLLANWLWNRQAAMAMLPKQPCILYGEHNQYICDQNGCTARPPK